MWIGDYGAAALPSAWLARAGGSAGRRWFAYASITLEALRAGMLFEVLDPAMVAPRGTVDPRVRSIGFLRPALWPEQYAGLDDGSVVVRVSGDEGGKIEPGRPVSVRVWGR